MSAKLLMMALGMGLVGLGVSQARAPQRYAPHDDATGRGRNRYGRGTSGDEGQRASLEPIQASPQAEAFVRRTAIAEIYDVQAARLALNKAQSADLRAFAALVIRDHTDAAGAMREATGGFPAPTSLDSEHQARIDRLNEVSDRDFDALYLRQQATALDETRSALTEFLQHAPDDGLRAFAQNLVTYLGEREKSLADLRRGSEGEPGVASY